MRQQVKLVLKSWRNQTLAAAFEGYPCVWRKTPMREPGLFEHTMSFFGDFSRATKAGMNRVVEARQRQAQRYVNGILLAMDDESLKRAGYDRKALERQESALYPF
jgi:hypothetical protein